MYVFFILVDNKIFGLIDPIKIKRLKAEDNLIFQSFFYARASMRSSDFFASTVVAAST